MDKNIKAFCIELRTLLEKYNVSLGVDIDGDTYGIHVNGFVAIDKSSDKEHTLNDYSLYLSAYDLKLYLDG